jgi:hypothetical protein
MRASKGIPPRLNVALPETMFVHKGIDTRVLI